MNRAQNDAGNNALERGTSSSETTSSVPMNGEDVAYSAPHSLGFSAKALIYFVRPVGAPGPIKIGSSTTPKNRLNFLLNWSPVDLELVCAAPGIRGVERAIKLRFGDHYIRNEWYEPCAGIVAILEEVQQTGRLPSDLAAEAHQIAKQKADEYRRWRDRMRKRDLARQHLPKKKWTPRKEMSPETRQARAARHAATLAAKRATLGTKRAMRFQIVASEVSE